MDESESVRKTPLWDQHVAAGAKMVEFAGWSMPVQYSGVMEEHRAVRSAAGLFDVSHMGQFRVSGSDAEAMLQSLTPNDVSKLVSGRAHYSGLLTERGTYLDDLLVYRLGESEFLLVVNAANRRSDFAWIRDRCPASVELTDETECWGLIALQGPRAQEILQPLTATELDSLKYYRFATGEVDGREALISRTGYTGEDGFELYVGADDSPALWARLLDAGAGKGLVPAGLGARDTLRLEAAMALYGNELDDTTTPLEAGLKWVVKMAKGDFVGRAALERQMEGGLQRRLVGFEVVGRGIVRHGAEVLAGDDVVGTVTSGTFSPTLEKAIGMAYVPIELGEPGVELTLRQRNRPLVARVVPMPFYKRG